MYPFVCSQLSLQAKAVKPKIDVNADPNAHLYSAKPGAEEPMYMISDPTRPVMQPGPMMHQPLQPMMPTPVSMGMQQRSAMTGQPMMPGGQPMMPGSQPNMQNYPMTMPWGGFA